jgi:hypothetical protein
LGQNCKRKKRKRKGILEKPYFIKMNFLKNKIKESYGKKENNNNNNKHTIY